MTGCDIKDSARTSLGTQIPGRVPSVPTGKRPVLIIEPEPREKVLAVSRVAKKDPLRGPEMVAARVRTETLRETSRRLMPISETIESSLAQARAHLQTLQALRSPAGRLAKREWAGLEQALEEIDRAQRDFHYHAAKAAVGMAEVHLPTLIRDAVKRAFPGTVGVGFRLPDLREATSICAHAVQLLEALTLAVGMVLGRIGARGELRVSLSRGSFFQEIVVAGIPETGVCSGTMPRPEEAQRLRHLVAGVHQGTLKASLGQQGEAGIQLALPLRGFEAEAHS